MRASGISFRDQSPPAHVKDGAAYQQAVDSPMSWSLPVRPMASRGMSHGSNSFGASSPVAGQLGQRVPSTAQATAATLYTGSEGTRRAHVQSLAKMSREQLAERLFADKQVIVNLRERLVRPSCLLASYRQPSFPTCFCLVWGVSNPPDTQASTRSFSPSGLRCNKCCQYKC